MTHLLTGSDDGYIRNYDIFASLNGKITLTAPQRHHCNVVEGNMKAGQIRCWWENPDYDNAQVGYPPVSEPSLSPVYSLAMHSDALWALGGTQVRTTSLRVAPVLLSCICDLQRGHINLFTVRHDPGKLIHVLHGHRGPVSALSVDHDEHGFFSASWDGEATVSSMHAAGSMISAEVSFPCTAVGFKHRTGRPKVYCPRRTTRRHRSKTAKSTDTVLFQFDILRGCCWRI